MPFLLDPCCQKVWSSLNPGIQYLAILSYLGHKYFLQLAVGVHREKAWALKWQNPLFCAQVSLAPFHCKSANQWNWVHDSHRSVHHHRCFWHFFLSEPMAAQMYIVHELFQLYMMQYVEKCLWSSYIREFVLPVFRFVFIFFLYQRWSQSFWFYCAIMVTLKVCCPLDVCLLFTLLFFLIHVLYSSSLLLSPPVRNTVSMCQKSQISNIWCDY